VARFRCDEHAARGALYRPAIGLSNDGTLAYVTNEGDNNLVVIDLATHAVTKPIAVGNAPRKIAIKP
jgi:YVTN family beta-propeller protein